MSVRNVMLVLITFFNTLFLVAGISIVYATIKFDIFKESFHFAIKDFIFVYQMIFLGYGVLLTVISYFGFMAIFSEKKIMLDVFGKLLFVLLIILVIIFCVCVWGKGPKFLRSTMYNSFLSYNTGSCRLDRSINALQSKFNCCGIESSDDWKHIKSYQMGNSSAEFPLSCCSIFNENYHNKCMSSYDNGCYSSVFRYICRFIHVFDAIGIGIALNLAFGIICVFHYISLFKNDQLILEASQTLEGIDSNTESHETTMQNIFQTVSKTNSTNGGTFV